MAEINVTVRKLGFLNVSKSGLVAGGRHLDDIAVRVRDGEEHVAVSLHNTVSAFKHQFGCSGEDIIAHVEVDGRSPCSTNSQAHVLVIQMSSLVGLTSHPDSIVRNVSSKF
jgi:hypothetical protein